MACDVAKMSRPLILLVMALSSNGITMKLGIRIKAE